MNHVLDVEVVVYYCMDDYDIRVVDVVMDMYDVVLMYNVMM